MVAMTANAEGMISECRMYFDTQYIQSQIQS